MLSVCVCTCVIRKKKHLCLNAGLSALLCSCRIQYVTLKITRKYVGDLALLKTMSFLINHNAQQSAAAPRRIWLLILGLIHEAKNQTN